MSNHRNVDRIIRNDRTRSIVVAIEPWGMAIELPPAESVHVRVRAPHGGTVEVESDTNSETVWAPPGSTVEVFKASELIYSSDVPVPDIPPGSSTRDFLKMVLGSGRSE